jgi:hypothetical protein
LASKLASLASTFAAADKTITAPLPTPAAARPVTAETKPPALPDPAGVTQAYAVARADLPPPQPRDSRPLFQSMFTDRSRKAVTQTVSSLWTSGSGTMAASADRAARPLDLFTDIQPGSRKLSGNS